MSPEEREWPGKAISQEDIEKGLVISTKDRPRARYAWTTGEAMGRFLMEMKNGRLIARKCHKCGRTLFPPRMFCELCFKRTDEWVYVQDTGTVETFSISYLDTDAKRIQEPILVGVVAIDGASEKMGIMHYFGEVGKDELRIGMHVKAVWKPPEERTGAITDIRYFRPLREGES